jgi:hypothetical protein
MEMGSVQFLINLIMLILLLFDSAIFAKNIETDKSLPLSFISLGGICADAMRKMSGRIGW